MIYPKKRSTNYQTKGMLQRQALKLLSDKLSVNNSQTSSLTNKKQNDDQWFFSENKIPNTVNTYNNEELTVKDFREQSSNQKQNREKLEPQQKLQRFYTEPHQSKSTVNIGLTNQQATGGSTLTTTVVTDFQLDEFDKQLIAELRLNKHKKEYQFLNF